MLVKKFEIGSYLYLLWYQKLVFVLPAERLHVTATVWIDMTVYISGLVHFRLQKLSRFLFLSFNASLADASFNKRTVLQSAVVSHLFFFIY